MSFFQTDPRNPLAQRTRGQHHNVSQTTVLYDEKSRGRTFQILLFSFFFSETPLETPLLSNNARATTRPLPRRASLSRSAARGQLLFSIKSYTQSRGRAPYICHYVQCGVCVCCGGGRITTPYLQHHDIERATRQLDQRLMTSRECDLQLLRRMLNTCRVHSASPGPARNTRCLRHLPSLLHRLDVWSSSAQFYSSDYARRAGGICLLFWFPVRL